MVYARGVPGGQSTSQTGGAGASARALLALAFALVASAMVLIGAHAAQASTAAAESKAEPTAQISAGSTTTPPAEASEASTIVPSGVAASAQASVEAAGSLPAFKLTIGDAYPYRGRRYVLPRARVEVAGSVAAALGGQTITVKISKGGHTVESRAVKLDERSGDSRFSFRFRVGKRGAYTVTTELPPEVAALAAAAEPKRVAVVRTNIHRGSRGVAVRVFQHALASLKYVVPRSGRFDAGTGRALMAYRKMTGMARNERAGYAVARKLAAGKGRFKLRRPGAGRHVEVSLRRQVMAFASGGKVVRIYHVSTGAPGTPTVRGSFRVYRKDWGTNAKGMVHSSYFIRGYAIHGFDPVPPYNASHGCVRVPIPNAASIFKWVQMGTRVIVY